MFAYIVKHYMRKLVGEVQKIDNKKKAAIKVCFKISDTEFSSIIKKRPKFLQCFARLSRGHFEQFFTYLNNAYCVSKEQFLQKTPL